MPNVYLAGDSCKSDADLVCMESAVETGLKAAAALLSDQGRTEPVEISRPDVPPRWLLAAARTVLLPVVTPAAVWLRRHDRRTP